MVVTVYGTYCLTSAVFNCHSRGAARQRYSRGDRDISVVRLKWLTFDEIV